MVLADEPILWHSPDPRFVLRVPELHVPRSLLRPLRRGTFRISLDRRFDEVIAACAIAPRPDQDGTWITDAMQTAFNTLHQRGLAHSVEAWDGSTLVGGLYGVSLGAGFFGESMFSHRPDASKVAFVTLLTQLERWGIELIDCQIHSEHLARFGAQDWPRPRFLQALRGALRKPTRAGRWQLDTDLKQGGLPRAFGAS